MSTHNITGQGAHPTLGRGKPVGIGRPGKNMKLPSNSTDIPKVARPGGHGGHKRVSSGGMPPKAARPGPKGSIGGGAGKPTQSPDW
jgi:hypothetical protein